ncbi:cation transporter, partial [candidate division KSB1 bacterium]
MSHHHEHEAPTSGGRLLITLIFNLIITVAEIIGGVLSGSLSLI